MVSFRSYSFLFSGIVLALWSLTASVQAALSVRRTFESNRIEAGILHISIDRERSKEDDELDREDDEERKETDTREQRFRIKNRGNIPLTYEVSFADEEDKQDKGEHTKNGNDCQTLSVEVSHDEDGVYSGPLGMLQFSRSRLSPGEQEHFLLHFPKGSDLASCHFSLRANALQYPNVDKGWTDMDTAKFQTAVFREDNSKHAEKQEGYDHQENGDDEYR